MDSLQQVYREYSRGSVYNYEDHVKLAEDLDKDGKLPATVHGGCSGVMESTGSVG
ncbi:MAG: hypothetical protein ACLR78_04840 [Roseburia sp.]